MGVCSCSLYALNMQYTTGMAATDQTSAVLLAGFPTAGGPQAISFTVALDGGLNGSVSAVAPYSSSYYLVRVSPCLFPGDLSLLHLCRVPIRPIEVPAALYTAYPVPFLQVSTPDGYIGSVTVKYRTSQLEPLKYYVVPNLVVKVTASSLSSLS